MIFRIFFLNCLFLAFRISFEVAGANHRCYVCIPNTGSSISDVVALFPKETIPLCNEFEPDKLEYIRECPPPYNLGCLSQTNGTHVTKTCSPHIIRDCKSANKIEYCYCTDELCNNQSVPIEEPVASNLPSDDEDSLFDGSGFHDTYDSKEIETSSEGDLGMDVIRHVVSTTTPESVIFSTTQSEDLEPPKASAMQWTLQKSLVFLLLFLFCFRLI